MASSLASIAETWPENVLTSMVSRKSLTRKIIARPYSDILGAGWIFRTKCDFLQVLDLLIFRQK